MNKELRLYSFVNQYLATIQQGIQTGHMTDEMSAKYLIDGGVCDITPASKMYIDWLKNHKTYIVLNGGDSELMYIEALHLKAYCIQLNLPFGTFNEPGCNGMMSCYGAVIPEKYFDAQKAIDNSYFWEKDGKYQYYDKYTPEYELITLIKSKPLAR